MKEFVLEVKDINSSCNGNNKYWGWAWGRSCNAPWVSSMWLDKYCNNRNSNWFKPKFLVEKRYFGHNSPSPSQQKVLCHNSLTPMTNHAKNSWCCKRTTNEYYLKRCQSFMNEFVLEMKQINSSCNGNNSEDELWGRGCGAPWVASMWTNKYGTG